MNEGGSGSKKENFKAEITFNMECQYNYFVCMNHCFHR